jgi:hypothetical protein
MTNAAAVLTSLGSSDLDVQVYDTVSTAAALAKAASDRAKVFGIAYNLFKANRSFHSLFELVDGILSGTRPVEPDAEPMTPQKVLEMIDNLAHIGRMVDYFHESMRRAGLTNNSLTAESIRKLQANNERLKDLIDWLDACAKPDELESVFNRAKQERDRGELFDLA